MNPSDVTQAPTPGGSLIHAALPAVMAGTGGFRHMRQLLLYDVASRVLPGLLSGLGALVVNRARARGERMCEKLRERVLMQPLADGPNGRKQGSVIIERSYKVTGECADMFDAVLSLASDLPQARLVRRTARGVFIVETKDSIALTDDVFFRKVEESFKDGEIERMVIEVFSPSRDIVQLRDYLTGLEGSHRVARANKLGRQLCYFDEMPLSVPMMRAPGDEACGIGAPARMVPDLHKAPRNLTFSMFALHTTKSMSNIYGEAVRTVRQRVSFFIGNRSWYEHRGIPYTLGILLHGLPGCGKTSFIKALARDTHRHVINIRLSPTTTVPQMMELFHSARISAVRGGVTETYEIPMDRRILVLEDVDCLSDVVNDRQKTGQAPVHGSSGSDLSLTLGVLLNLLDGVLETPGRIMVMTTNHPERLDPALVRPGRIDVAVNFESCSADDVLEIVQGITGWAPDDPAAWRARIPHRVWTPAEVTKVVFECAQEPDKALERLCAERAPSMPTQSESFPCATTLSSTCAPAPSSTFASSVDMNADPGGSTHTLAQAADIPGSDAATAMRLSIDEPKSPSSPGESRLRKSPASDSSSPDAEQDYALEQSSLRMEPRVKHIPQHKVPPVGSLLLQTLQAGGPVAWGGGTYMGAPLDGPETAMAGMLQAPSSFDFKEFTSAGIEGVEGIDFSAIGPR